MVQLLTLLGIAPWVGISPVGTCKLGRDKVDSYRLLEASGSTHPPFLPSFTSPDSTIRINVFSQRGTPVTPGADVSVDTAPRRRTPTRPTRSPIS